jgi:hypothetical protein
LLPHFKDSDEALVKPTVNFIYEEIGRDLIGSDDRSNAHSFTAQQDA